MCCLLCSLWPITASYQAALWKICWRVRELKSPAINGMRVILFSGSPQQTMSLAGIAPGAVAVRAGIWSAQR